MDEALLQEIFEQLFQSLETAETQSAALLQFLKAKGIAKDEDLAPYFEQASKASSVSWVATRARINRLLSAATRPTENSENSGSDQAAAPRPAKSADTSAPAENSKQAPQGTSVGNQSPDDQETPEKDSTPSAEAKGPSEENENQAQGKPRSQPEAA